MEWDNKRLLAKVSMLYYLDGFTQAEIARKYNVSRPVISKALNRAKEMGIVEIYIKDESVHTIELEQQIEKKFGLKDAIVVSTAGISDEFIKKTMAKAASSYITRNLDGVSKLGISWGSAIAEVVEEFPFRVNSNINIVPIVGGMGSTNVSVHANHLAYKLAKKLNGKSSYLYAPAMVESVELKNRLVESNDIASVIKDGRDVDIAIVGIGDPFQYSTMEKIGYLKSNDFKELKEANVVGDINSRFFDDKGEQIYHYINERVIGLDLNDLKKINQVIAIANGAHKVNSIKVALTSGIIDVLVTDEITANSILE